MVGNDILKRLTLNFDTSKALQAPQMNITRRAKLLIIYNHNTILSGNVADTFPLFLTLKKTNCQNGNRAIQTSTIINQILVQDLPPSFPCVLKVGHAHGGLGKVKVEGETSWKDLARFFRTDQRVLLHNCVPLPAWSPCLDNTAPWRSTSTRSTTCTSSSWATATVP